MLLSAALDEGRCSQRVELSFQKPLPHPSQAGLSEQHLELQILRAAAAFGWLESGSAERT